MLETLPTFGTSRGVRSQFNLTAAATVENSTQWQRTQFSAPMAETQLSVCMVQSQILNSMVGPQLLNTIVRPQLNVFSKSSKFSAHLFWAWRHPHSRLISCLGLLWQWWLSYPLHTSLNYTNWLHTWTLNPNSSTPNQTEL